jgi:hypothetical protein
MTCSEGSQQCHGGRVCGGRGACVEEGQDLCTCSRSCNDSGVVRTELGLAALSEDCTADRGGVTRGTEVDSTGLRHYTSSACVIEDRGSFD